MLGCAGSDGGICGWAVGGQYRSTAWVTSKGPGPNTCMPLPPLTWRRRSIVTSAGGRRPRSGLGIHGAEAGCRRRRRHRRRRPAQDRRRGDDERAIGGGGGGPRVRKSSCVGAARARARCREADRAVGAVARPPAGGIGRGARPHNPCTIRRKLSGMRERASAVNSVIRKKSARRRGGATYHVDGAASPSSYHPPPSSACSAGADPSQGRAVPASCCGAAGLAGERTLSVVCALRPMALAVSAREPS